jgi:hypothetical protein
MLCRTLYSLCLESLSSFNYFNKPRQASMHQPHCPIDQIEAGARHEKAQAGGVDSCDPYAQRVSARAAYDELRSLFFS